MVFLVVGEKLGIVFYFCGGIFFVYMFYEDDKLIVFVCVGYGGRWKFLIVLNLVRYLKLILRILVFVLNGLRVKILFIIL